MRLVFSTFSVACFIVPVIRAHETETSFTSEPASSSTSFLETEHANCNTGAITSLTATRVGSTWIYLTWEVPEGCDKQHQYNISYRVNVSKTTSNGPEHSSLDSLTNWYFTVEKNLAQLNLTATETNNGTERLEPCTEYRISISALPYAGKPAEVQMFTAPDPRQIQLRNLASQISSDDFNLTWAQSSCPLLHTYLITLLDSQGARKSTMVNKPYFSTSSRETNVSNLIKPCSDYTVTISPRLNNKMYQATNAYKTLTIRTDSAFPYAKNITIPDIHQDWFVVQWEPPACQLEAVQGYNILVKGGKTNRLNHSNSQQPLMTANVSTSSMNLSICTNYSIAIETLYNASSVNRTRPAPYWYPFTTAADEIGSQVQELRIDPFERSFNVSWNRPSCNIQVDKYRIQVNNEEVSGTQDGQLHFNCDSSYCGQIRPCTTYNISVTPVVQHPYPEGKTVWSHVTTLPELTNPVILRNRRVDNKEISVSWDYDQDLLQCVEEFHVQIRGQEGEHRIEPSENPNVIFSNLEPCTSYQVTVKAVGFNKTSDTSQVLRTKDIDPKPKYDFEEPSYAWIEPSSVNISWRFDDSFSCFGTFEVNIHRVIESQNQINPYVYDKIPTANKCTECYQLYTQYFLGSYILENLRAKSDQLFPSKNPFFCSRLYLKELLHRYHQVGNTNTEEEELEHVVSMSTPNKYSVHHLERGVRYEAVITMWTKNKDFSVTSSKISIYFMEPMSATSVALIGIICVLVVVVALAALKMFMSKQRNRVNRASRANLSGGKLHPLASIRKSRPIRVEDFAKVTAFLTAMRNQELEREYHELKLISAQRKRTTESERPDNRIKNRYVNILPYDDHRVKLSVVDDDPCSDYINASYIEGINGPEEYIAAQGPLCNTVADFWRMIWEQDVHIIIMLTGLLENGKPKCSPYWPGKDLCQKHGSFKLENTEETVNEEWVIRKFRLIHGERQRTVYQYHFDKWPDFGCPENPLSFLEFVQDVRSRIEMLPVKNHILVHCSAGVGRTGTFIAIDLLTQQVFKSSELDIFGTVVKLRSFRTLMVQNEDQYSFIYNCINEFVQIAISTNDEDYDNDSVVLLKDCYADNNDVGYADDVDCKV